MRREVFRNWLGPFCVALAIAAAHTLGVFAHTDGRFFDFVSLQRMPASPGVVIISNDLGPDNAASERSSQLEQALVSSGVARIGYLGASRASTNTPEVPVIVGRPVRSMPATNQWVMAEDGEAATGVSAAARHIAPAQYGINRAQIGALPSRQGPIPVFDTALAGRSADASASHYLVPMPKRQNIPILGAAQLINGDVGANELDGMIAMVVGPQALEGSLHTPLDPNGTATSEAVFRAHSINALLNDDYGYQATFWKAWLLVFLLTALLAMLYRRVDPKRVAVTTPMLFSVIAVLMCAVILAFTGEMLPITALVLAPWLITFQRIIARETSQDLRLERTASRAVQTSFNRSALREGARLPQFLNSAAGFAGVEHSLLLQMSPDGNLEAVAQHNASLDDIALGGNALRKALSEVSHSLAMHDAAAIVPGWPGEARISWVGSGDDMLFWLHTRPETATPGKSAHLVRAVAASFRKLFHWRAELHARGSREDRNRPIDDRVASAIALMAHESEQVRTGFDTIDTAVMIFHLIGSPLHANTAMHDIYAEADLEIYETSLSDALLALSDLGPKRIQALIKDMMLNGTEVCMPMRTLGEGQDANERMLRLAAPSSNARGGDRVIVLEAIDMREANRAADLRKAVAKFIDRQLRNDFEAIMLGTKLASDERLQTEQIRSVVSRIGDTAHRATARLDEVAALIRSETTDVPEACYPVEVKQVVSSAIARASGLASELGVSIEAETPDLSAFTMAEPVALTEMLLAMLRVVIADTPQGGTVSLSLRETEGRTLVRISGGFGMSFDRLLWLLSNYEEGAVGEYRAIGEGMAKVTRWNASVSYWGSETNGFGFSVDMRGID